MVTTSTLIEALTIFLKYKDVKEPFYCENDILYILNYESIVMEESDKLRLHELGFQYMDKSSPNYSTLQYTGWYFYTQSTV